MNDREKFLSRMVGLSGMIDAGLIVAISASWIGLLGDAWWFFDLFSHFQIQYLCVCFAGIAWFLWRSKRALLGVSVASAVLNFVVMAGLFAGTLPPRTTVPEFRLRVVSINVHTSNRSFKKVIDFVRASKADIVLLLEIDQTWATNLAPLAVEFPHSLIDARDDNFGIAFYSKVETARLKSEMIGEAWVPSIVADLEAAGRAFQFVGTHPLPPSGGENSSLRDNQLRELEVLANRSDLPVMVVGDLNATPWSAGMRILLRDGRLRLPARSIAWQPTWMVGTPFAIPIDHALVSGPLVLLSRQVGPDVGSDHRPIIMDVGWSE